MKKLQYILIGTALTAFPLEGQAQKQVKDSTVNRTVVVEQEYNPDIMDASKVNVLPDVEPPAISKKEVEYDVTLMPAREIPAITMQAYTGKETQQKALPGYVRLGYGNYGNLDARANYLFTLPNRDRLNLTFHMNGMDGKLNLPENKEDWISYYYHTYAGMDYVHSFKKSELNVAGKFGLSNFNFLPGSINDRQKFTSGNIHFGIKSTDKDMPLRFCAETNLLFYERLHDIILSNSKEGIVRTKVDVAGSISEEQSVGVAFDMDNFFYNSNGFDNHTMLNLNPYYLFLNDDWKVRLGAHVDLAFGLGKQLRISPDVTAQYTFSDSYILYAQAKGGKIQNDFRRLEAISLYGEIAEQPDATYEQLNAAIGFKASPVNGLWFNLYGGWQDLKNDLLQAQAPTAHIADGPYINALLLHSANTRNIYAGAEVRYSYKGIVSFMMSGLYRDWSINDTQKSMLYLQPAFEGNLRIDLRPASSVQISLGYQNVSREKTEGEKATPVSNLYLNGNYEIFNGISVYARLSNLLNKKYQLHWGYPSEGINFTGGVSFLF
ncbi:TonB-dependent receptor [Bacteroides helcogenes]|uniref:TonB-dependent receptor n=1 Tax=Bacteroides helcogenes (strain ATCC 35417 / DSM 20613 / JCM 6297 / CCUG 15421 / P 36-108) TaxID=693979 RepID=E6SQ42_BACT6|nr:TonB-dependent receptor [Bacteroides helcogenes]ADV42947.1 putative TonB-dependent receptor [Bacteroides helcogenes P 36-108]MDY5237010.1 TonB-dependent receptor [Bacteroides helcogenes]